MKIKITAIGKKDAFYVDRKELVGEVGTLIEDIKNGDWDAPIVKFDKPLMGLNYPPTCNFYNVKYEVIEEDTVNLEVKFDRKTAKKLEKLAKRWNLTQEETLVRILTEITTNKSVTPRDLTPDELAAFE